MSIFDDLSNYVGTPSAPPPSIEVIEWLHAHAPKDRADDMHHELGTGPTHAARGNHVHDGTDSAALWARAAVPSPASNSNADLYSALNTIAALLRTKGS